MRRPLIEVKALARAAAFATTRGDWTEALDGWCGLQKFERPGMPGQTRARRRHESCGEVEVLPERVACCMIRPEELQQRLLRGWMVDKLELGCTDAGRLRQCEHMPTGTVNVLYLAFKGSAGTRRHRVSGQMELDLHKEWTMSNSERRCAEHQSHQPARLFTPVAPALSDDVP